MSIVIQQVRKNEGLPRIIKISNNNLECITNSSDLIVGCKSKIFESRGR